MIFRLIESREISIGGFTGSNFCEIEFISEVDIGIVEASAADDELLAV